MTTSDQILQPSDFDLLQAFPVPAVVTDDSGRCLDRNSRFEAVLPKLEATVTVGRIRFGHSDVQALWATALTECVGTVTPQVLKVNFKGRLWRMNLSPMASHAAFGDRPVVLAVFDDRTPEVPEIVAVARDVKLTPAEREVLAHLLNGVPAKTIAGERAASVNTVRAQIVAILSKTGHNSQRELMAAYGNSSYSSVHGGSEIRSGHGDNTAWYTPKFPTQGEQRR